MALNVKILFPLDHPPVSFPDDEPIELSASASELNTAKENLQKDHLLESEEDHIYLENSLESQKKKLNILT
ncbi:hypothetical protein BIY24_09180 [Halobacteriovorax marinus]|uniref:Uncharacterized protein n=1 Tax=Halobacteriovorax marinus (strain ATCC BAA-682 / DSM 15412 / SJ) TaxID=862908 RepID=E1X2K5_HALMS|nr:hypothetical protein [Halobacteriovorax marinus]ATH08115.1 hypothetical protein BIY24_09180 [Halobacteriovorax marinus]CBW26772.1 hypothetical protein BMS_1957 [Halobacteriovorax marinus SJ]